MKQQFGHTLSRNEVKERVTSYWDFKEMYPFPTPKDTIFCPCCSKNEVILKSYSFFEKQLKPYGYRVDINFKCCNCSMVWSHGIPIIYKMWKDADGQKGHIRLWTWREAQRYIDDTRG